MGCGGSKEPTSAPKGKPGSKTKPQQGQKSNQNSPARRSLTSKYGENDRGKTRQRRPPKGLRRPSVTSSKKVEVPFEASYQSPIPYEPENLILEGNWELEKGVDDQTTMTDSSYPPPRVGKPLIDRYSFSAVDFEVMRYNDLKLATGSFEEVAKKLTSSHEADVLKVRALCTWMSCQKIRTRTYGNDAKPGTVLGYMKQIKELKGTYAGLLTNLCRSIEIPCVIVKGIYKTPYHIVGDDDLTDFKCTWTVVYMNGGWHILHPYLICTPLSTKTQHQNWTLLETSKTDDTPRPGAVLNTFFFAPNPLDFIHCCRPDDSNQSWQLLDDPWTYEEFQKAPFLRPAFFMNSMTLKSRANCVLLANEGKCTIKLKCDSENVGSLNIMYELYSIDSDVTLGEDCGKIVMCGRNEETWNVQIKFPVAGTFKLALYGQMLDWFFWLADFKIGCDSPVSNFVAAPMAPPIGWGPSMVSEDAGLYSPSHEGGIIFYKPKEQHTIKFLINDRANARAELEHSEMNTADLKKHCKLNIKKTELDFVITLPRGGEYALKIYTIDEYGDEFNVCNYLFTEADEVSIREVEGFPYASCGHQKIGGLDKVFEKSQCDELPSQQNVFQRKARYNLREATAGQDIVTLENCLQKFKIVKLEEDDDFLRGKRRLHYLKLKKGLRDGRMRRHEQTLEQAITDVENSSFRKALKPNTDKAKEMLSNIKSLEMHCHPVQNMTTSTISEIANFANPTRDVHDTMIATYLLLGEQRKKLETWGYIQSLLRKQGRDGIKQKVAEFSKNEGPELDHFTIVQVKKLIDGVPKPYIMSASLSAAAFYDWVNSALAFLSNTSQNALDDIFVTEESYTGSELNNHNVSKNTLNNNDEDLDRLSQDEGFLDSLDIDSSNTDDRMIMRK